MEYSASYFSTLIANTIALSRNNIGKSGHAWLFGGEDEGLQEPLENLGRTIVGECSLQNSSHG